MVLGQLLMALFIDKYGFLGMPIRGIGWNKIVGLILVFIGITLFNLKK
ncbi:DMT family transporter [Suttonella ornithocola]|uniref:Uncharacterized protein conserved in bacteria n=1 Tax=Suttonella ornithocola TaxID=279832 RepID=A0A380MNZ8_9GAMM|nr:DMT family transporter [Suttonella ornithocola]SUO93756.1 Uncharacterized protein conserved in bacteria [Suttonella ornithocola]